MALEENSRESFHLKHHIRWRLGTA